MIGLPAPYVFWFLGIKARHDVPEWRATASDGRERERKPMARQP